MSAVNDLKLLCETLLHLDEEGLKKFNFSRENLFEQWTGPMISSLKESSGNLYGEEQYARVANALIDSLKKVRVETNSTDDDSKVEITVTGLNFAKEFGVNNLPPNIAPNSSPKEIAEALIKMIEDKFKEIEPEKTTVFVVECARDENKNLWVPKNLQEFFNVLTMSSVANN